MAEYYSYSTIKGHTVSKFVDIPNHNKFIEFEGRLFTHVDEESNMPAEISIDEFIEDGYINEYWYNGNGFEARHNEEDNDTSTRAIIIPITDEQGDRIHDAAQELLYEAGVYNMWANNCLQVANRLIGAGGEDLLLAQDVGWLSEHWYNVNIYQNAVMGATLIPNQDYLLASFTADWRGYEQIELGMMKEGACIDD